MLHFVFSRAVQSLKVFDETGATLMECAASGDAWGDGISGPYGFDYPIAPGHYKLTGVDPIVPPIAAEGAAQIDVADLTASDLTTLADAHKGAGTADSFEIGGIVLPTGGLAKYNRSAIMIHGGGSNAPDPFAPAQELCKTEGCTRCYNRDLPTLCEIVRNGIDSSQIVIFSCIGDPKPLAC